MRRRNSSATAQLEREVERRRARLGTDLTRLKDRVHDVRQDSAAQLKRVVWIALATGAAAAGCYLVYRSLRRPEPKPRLALPWR